MFILTAGALIYIHLQFQIFDLAYQGRCKEVAVQKLVDDNSSAMYSIHRLKSASNLGVKLLGDSSHMQFMDGEHIVRLKTPVQTIEKIDLALAKPIEKKQSFLASILALRSQAEAKSIR